MQEKARPGVGREQGRKGTMPKKSLDPSARPRRRDPGRGKKTGTPPERRLPARKSGKLATEALGADCSTSLAVALKLRFYRSEEGSCTGDGMTKKSRGQKQCEGWPGERAGLLGSAQGFPGCAFFGCGGQERKLGVSLSGPRESRSMNQ